MKISEILNEDNTAAGTYAYTTLSNNTKSKIDKYIRDNKIPNGLYTKDMHATLLYSRTPVPNEAFYQGKYPTPITGQATGLDVWDTKPTNGNPSQKALVLKFDSPELYKRHQYFRQKYGATHDYPDFHTHITLSYDIGNLDVKSLPDVKQEIGTIEMDKEYSKPNNPGWKPSSTR